MERLKVCKTERPEHHSSLNTGQGEIKRSHLTSAAPRLSHPYISFNRLLETRGSSPRRRGAVKVLQSEGETDLCSRSPRDCKGVLQHLEASDLTLGDSQDNRKG